MVVRALGNSAASFRDRFNRTGNRASIPYVPPPFSATGGNVSALAPGNGYKYHTFTSPGTFTVTSGTGDIEYIVVAGGGGGANGGGGGAGGLLSNSVQMPSPTRQAPFPVSGPSSYPVVIGAGGVAGLAYPGATDGGQGGTSSFGPISATGGGGGAGGDAGPPGAGGPGGSGGGAMAETFGAGTNPGGAATNYPGSNQQGYPGGGAYQYVGGNSSTGGGGGAGTAGQDGSPPSAPVPTRKSGDGGNGLQFPAFTGPLIGVPALAPLSGYFAGGGGGGSWGNPGGAGGLGGGVAGSGTGTTPAGAQANTGGGGGGSGYPSWVPGGTGGSGIVIIRYLA